MKFKKPFQKISVKKTEELIFMMGHFSQNDINLALKWSLNRVSFLYYYEVDSTWKEKIHKCLN